MPGCCDYCMNPAQWVMLWVTRFEHTEAEKAKKLIPKGPAFELGGGFCQAHKAEIELTPVPAGLERVFRFAGAVSW